MFYLADIIPAAMTCLGVILIPMPADFADDSHSRQSDYLPITDYQYPAGDKSSPEASSDEPEQFIPQVMATYHVPGVAAAIVKNGRVLWTGAYGFADFDANTPVADTTSFMLASISKTVTGTALMQLWENGYFELDDHINDYLPFAVYNPNFPGQEITFRQVLTHTSSLRDNWDVMWSVYYAGDCPIPLGYYVEEYFTPGGEYYSTLNNFYSWAPGAGWSYCNEAFALAGYLVEAISGIDFDQYSRDSIFMPLGLEHTSWFLEGMDTSNVAMPYTFSAGVFQPIGHFGYADYPAGQLRSSVRDLSRHVMIYMNHGEVDGVRILDSATVAEILTIQFPSIRSDQGLTWFRYFENNQERWRHGGGDQGVSTLAAFCPQTGTGVVVLTNISSGTATGIILSRLFEYASRDIILTGEEIIDDIGGDDDGIPEAGETVQIICTFTNLFADTVNDVRIALIADDASLHITNAVAELGQIAPNDTASNSHQPFELEIPADYISRLCEFSILLSGNGGETLDTITITKAMGRTSLLLIDDDNSRNLETYYTGCLERMRIPCQRIVSPPVPAPETFDDYDAVIWFTGDYRADPLDAGEISAIKDYLDTGGSLFLTGQGIAAQLKVLDPDFLQGYLKSQYLSSSLIPVLTASGGPVFDLTDTVAIHGSGGASNQTLPDHVTAINDGIDEMAYYNQVDFGAVSYTGAYKLVFFGFSFEAIVDSDYRWTRKDIILGEILDFFEYRMPVTPIGLAVAPGDPMHLTDHSPEISWQSGDPEYTQAQYQIQVGDDNDWISAEMWDYGPIAGSEMSVIYAGVELLDGQTYYFRIRTDNGVAWSNWYYGSMRMNSTPTTSTGLVPDNMQEIEITPPSLSHNNSEDSENDILTYTYELYDDSLLSSLVAQASEYPQGSGGTTVWTVPSILPDGEDYFWRVRAGDGFEFGAWSNPASFYMVPSYLCGDANGDELINAGDAVYIINLIFKGGPAPDPMEAGDTNADGLCNIGDAVYLVHHIFRQGPEPVCP